MHLFPSVGKPASHLRSFRNLPAMRTVHYACSATQPEQQVIAITDRAAAFVWVSLPLLTSRDTTWSCTVIVDAHQ